MPYDQNLHPHQHTHIPERDDFRSTTAGEAERYQITRDAVLKHLAEERAVNRLFLRWDTKTEVLKLAKAVAKAKDRRQYVAYGRFIEGVRSLPRIIGFDAALAAVSWGMPYHFVSNGVVNEYIQQRAAIAHGFPFRTWTEIQKDTLKIELTIPGNESDATLEKVFDRIRQARTPDALAPGRAPMTNKKNADATATKGAHLDRNARWLVRHHVGNIPSVELAREHYGEQFEKLQNPVSTITKGIESAQKLLNLTTYVIPPDLTRK